MLSDIFHTAGITWDVSLPHTSDDTTRLAAEAAAESVDLVAVCGCDGTQMEAINGLQGTGGHQAILPGGTGKAMEHD
jgi:diacylglycerol kinase family enzyme